MGSDSLQGWELALYFFVCELLVFDKKERIALSLFLKEKLRSLRSFCKEPPALIARVAFSFEKVKRVNQSFCSSRSFNPNKSGIGGKPPTFVQNDFTP